jgi:hypothetical protein
VARTPGLDLLREIALLALATNFLLKSRGVDVLIIWPTSGAVAHDAV